MEKCITVQLTNNDKTLDQKTSAILNKLSEEDSRYMYGRVNGEMQIKKFSKNKVHLSTFMVVDIKHIKDTYYKVSLCEIPLRDFKIS